MKQSEHKEIIRKDLENLGFKLTKDQKSHKEGQFTILLYLSKQSRVVIETKGVSGNYWILVAETRKSYSETSAKEIVETFNQYIEKCKAFNKVSKRSLGDKEKPIMTIPYIPVKAEETKEVTDKELFELMKLQDKWNRQSDEESWTTKVFLNSYTDEYLWVQILCFVMDDPTQGIMETKTAWNRKKKEWED